MPTDDDDDIIIIIRRAMRRAWEWLTGPFRK